MAVNPMLQKTFGECFTTYRASSDPAIKTMALHEMMSKASTKEELEIVRDLAHPNSPMRALAAERLELKSSLTSSVGQSPASRKT